MGVRQWAGAVATAVLGVGLSVAIATPAEAHGNCDARHGQDYACVYAGHNAITWCDVENDGHRTRAYYVTRNGFEHFSDWDGGAAGCGYKSTNSEIVYYAVCEEGEGCGRSEWA